MHVLDNRCGHIFKCLTYCWRKVLFVFFFSASNFKRGEWWSKRSFSWQNKKQLTKTDLCAGIGGPFLPGLTNISVWICALKAETKPLRKTKSSFCWLNCSICSEHHLIQSSSVCRGKIISMLVLLRLSDYTICRVNSQVNQLNKNYSMLKS